MPETEEDKAFVEYVVKAIVDHPDEVKVERTIDERGVLITLGVNPEDMGKVIGKEGRTAKSLRTLLRVLGAKFNARVNMKILEPEGSERRMAEEIKEAPVALEPEKTAPEEATTKTGKPVEEGKATEVI
ncbi:KH domain-containing protein [Candidatus Berkelbacteria bacterium]|nr:KH domain-containing protein [Candidatus Berkelbacteria bacterium]MBI2588210.1 KH domain-containing protein [Candidatus Berkelbacteria bacterium]MBI4029862.1 KH domain-containing protein [Candidatus Berkelbacteria bacterium]